MRLSLTQGQWESLKNIAPLVGVAVAVIGAMTKSGIMILPHLKSWWNRRTLKQRLGANEYTVTDFKDATDLYIEPDSQSVDPSGGEDFRRVVSAREPLFRITDRLLENPGQYKFLIVLADSGMGKTCFVLNYYASHWRHWLKRNRFDLHLVPLGLQNADKLIEKIPDDVSHDTVLFLDGLDEDMRAIEDHRARVGELLKLTRRFRTVLITCRTQFFPKDEEIPNETGIAKVSKRRAGEAGDYWFH